MELELICGFQEAAHYQAKNRLLFCKMGKLFFDT